MLSLQELLVWLLVLSPFILLPTFIGYRRGHPNMPGLVAVNILLLPIFGIGWILALVWSITVPDHVDP